MDDLGLVRLLLSYATIIGSIFGFGVYNLIIREVTDEKSDQYKNSVQGYALLLCLIGWGIIAAVLYLQPDILLNFVNEGEAPLLMQRINSLLALCFVIIFTQLLSSFIISKHKSPFVQFIQDPFLKTAYFSLSLTYLLVPFSFDLFLNLFVLIYVLSVVFLFVYSLKTGFKFTFNFKLLPVKELLKFSGYTFFDKGLSFSFSFLKPRQNGRS